MPTDEKPEEVEQPGIVWLLWVGRQLEGVFATKAAARRYLKGIAVDPGTLVGLQFRGVLR